MINKFLRVLRQSFFSIDKSEDFFTVSQKFRNDIKSFFEPQKYRFLEVGCYRGLTAKVLSSHFTEYLGVDNRWQNLLVARIINVFKSNVSFHKYDLYDNSDWSELNFAADIILIDASHSYEDVCQDIENCIKRYQGAFIIFDDYGAHEGVYKSVNEYIQQKHLELLAEIGAEKGQLDSPFPNQLGSEGLICRVC